MANRIVGNVVIVDSAMGNAFILAQGGSPIHEVRLHANMVSFFSNDTTGRLQISGVNTTNIIVSMGWLVNGTGSASVVPASQNTSFGQEQPLDSLKVPTLTAGTAWIYLV